MAFLLLATPPHSQHWANTHRPEQTVKIMTIITPKEPLLLEGRPTGQDGKAGLYGSLEDKWSTYSLQCWRRLQKPALETLRFICTRTEGLQALDVEDSGLQVRLSANWPLMASPEATDR